MKELVVISGKGGTGKTSIVASFASLASSVVLADCDVDAADLHLVVQPDVRQRADFSGGNRASIDPERCTGCGKCGQLCRFDAVLLTSCDDMAAIGVELAEACRSCNYCRRSCSVKASSEIQAMIRDAVSQDTLQLMIDPISCEGCGVCAEFCPAGAIDFAPAVNGEWYISDTRHGPMVHAKLNAGEENSGKLVSTVRSEAKKIAEDRELDLVLIDGSPGIGCPVIASMAGADVALIVTEPTLSGLHDLQRAVDLTRHFSIDSLVCVNKWDLNASMTDTIEQWAASKGVPLAGRVRYDSAVTRAQVEQKSIAELDIGGVAEDVRQLWRAVNTHLEAETT